MAGTGHRREERDIEGLRRRARGDVMQVERGDQAERSAYAPPLGVVGLLMLRALLGWVQSARADGLDPRAEARPASNPRPRLRVDAHASTPAALDDAQAHERLGVLALKAGGERHGLAWVKCKDAQVEDERGQHARRLGKCRGPVGGEHLRSASVSFTCADVLDGDISITIDVAHGFRPRRPCGLRGLVLILSDERFRACHALKDIRALRWVDDEDSLAEHTSILPCFYTQGAVPRAPRCVSTTANPSASVHTPSFVACHARPFGSNSTSHDCTLAPSLSVGVTAVRV
jgi:hypothetical protein